MGRQKGCLFYEQFFQTSNDTSPTDRLVSEQTICWMRQRQRGLL
jgi:hypothetical protein